MGSLVLIAIKLCLVVRMVSGREIAEQPKNNIAIPVQDTLQHTDEINLKPTGSNEKAVEDNTAMGAAPEGTDNRAIIDAPGRPCQPCYRRDHRGVCRRIVGCSRDAGITDSIEPSTNEKSVEDSTTFDAAPEGTGNRAIIDAPGRPCQPCYRRDHRGVCRRIIGCSRDAGMPDIIEASTNEESVDLKEKLVENTATGAILEGEDTGNRAIIDASGRPCQPCYRRDSRGVCRRIIGCSRDAGISDFIEVSTNEKSVDDTTAIGAAPESTDNRAIIDAPGRPCQPCYRRDIRGVCRRIIGCPRDVGISEIVEASTNEKSVDLNEKLVEDNISTDATAEDADNRAIIDAPGRPCQPCYRRDSRGVCRRIIGCSRDAGMADFIESSSNEKSAVKDDTLVEATPENTDSRTIIDAPGRPCQPCYRRDHRGVCRRIIGCSRAAGTTDFIEPSANEKSVEDITTSDAASEDTSNRAIIDAPGRPCQPCYRRDSRGVCRRIIGCSRDAGTANFIEPSTNEKAVDLNEKLVEDNIATEATAEDADNRAIIDAPGRPCQPCYRRDHRGVCRRIIGCSRDAGIPDTNEASSNEKSVEDTLIDATPEGSDNRAIIDAPGRPCQLCYRRDSRGVCRRIIGCSRDAGISDFIEPTNNEKSVEDGTVTDTTPEGTGIRTIIDDPTRACQPCYRRDNRGICRKIIGCSSGAAIKTVLLPPLNPCPPCHRHDKQGVCRELIVCES